MTLFKIAGKFCSLLLYVRPKLYCFLKELLHVLISTKVNLLQTEWLPLCFESILPNLFILGILLKISLFYDMATRFQIGIRIIDKVRSIATLTLVNSYFRVGYVLKIRIEVGCSQRNLLLHIIWDGV